MWRIEQTKLLQTNHFIVFFCIKGILPSSTLMWSIPETNYNLFVGLLDIKGQAHFILGASGVL